MTTYWDYIRGAEWVLAIALAALAGVLWLTARGLRRWERRPLGELAGGENGAAQSVAFVMTIPLYALLVALLIEATQLMIAKVGTTSAAYSAARSAVAWGPAEQTHPKRAAVIALAAFASGTDAHAPQGGPSQDATEYARRMTAGGWADARHDELLRAKYRYAEKNTAVEVRKIGLGPTDPIRVRVTYDAPTYAPGVGRFFGQLAPGGRYYTVRIVSEVTLPDDAPRSDDGTLGVIYHAP